MADKIEEDDKATKIMLERARIFQHLIDIGVFVYVPMNECELVPDPDYDL